LCRTHRIDSCGRGEIFGKHAGLRSRCSKELGGSSPPARTSARGKREEATVAYEVELELARELALLGGEIAMRYYRRDPQANRKPDGTWVTEADRAAERELRSKIAARFPEHNVWGEEEGLTRAEGGPASPDSASWVIDPIDGTNNFIAGIPIWGVLVALRQGDQSILGVCHLPALGETYEASLGGGARMNGEPITVDGSVELEKATVVTSGDHRFYERGTLGFWEELVSRCWRVRGFGDCWAHLLVSRGAVHAMLEPELSVWDFAALEPILAEAGGRITTFEGSAPEHGGSCLSTNGSIHDEILEIYRRHAGGRDA
jgi:histidinol-phosphatase